MVPLLRHHQPRSTIIIIRPSLLFTSGIGIILLVSIVSSYAPTTSSKMTSMLRYFARGGSRNSAFLGIGRVSNGKQTSAAASAPVAASRFMATQSGDDVKPPTALARLHLEDGSTLTGRSFGCHESVSGEVSFVHISCASQLLY